jgi:hypothetical protein
MTVRGLVVATTVCVALGGTAAADPRPAPRLSAAEKRCRAEVDRFLRTPGWTVAVEVRHTGYFRIRNGVTYHEPRLAWRGETTWRGHTRRISHDGRIDEVPTWEPYRRFAPFELEEFRAVVLTGCSPPPPKFEEGSEHPWGAFDDPYVDVTIFVDARGRTWKPPRLFQSNFHIVQQIGFRPRH